MSMRPLLPWLLPLALAGCVPAPYGSYYKPVYPDPSSIITKPYCGGMAGPPTQLSFTGPEGIKLSISATKAYAEKDRKDWPLSLSIDIPKGSTFRFLEEGYEIAYTPSDKGSMVRGEILVSTAVTLPANAWIDVDQVGPTSADLTRQYLASSPSGSFAEIRLASGVIKGLTPESLGIQLPDIMVADRRISMPLIELLKLENSTRLAGMTYRSSAHAGALGKRFAECTRNTPDRLCSNILNYDSESFKNDVEDFSLLGRVWLSGDGNTPDLHYEIRMRTRVAARWRFASKTIRFTDVSTGAEHAQDLGPISVFWRYPVPFMSGLTSTDRGERSNTGIVINGSLGQEEQSRYFIRLPPFILNGRQYQLKPIELELHRFDGGLQPFNC